MIYDGTSSDAWLSRLFEENYVLLYRVGRVFLGSFSAQEDMIEDQIQETFVIAWERQQKLMNHPNPAGWLVETFRRRLMAQCRKLGREWKRQAFSLDEKELPLVVNQDIPTVEDLLQGKEQLALLKRLLGEKDADIFLRYCVQGQSAAQVASAYDMTESSVRVRVSRTKKKLLHNRAMFSCLVLLLTLSLGLK